MTRYVTLSILCCSLFFIGCNNDRRSPADVTGKSKEPAKPRIKWKTASDDAYHKGSSKDWVMKNGMVKDTAALGIILSVNRTDSAHLHFLDSVIVPDDLSGDRDTYMPFPRRVNSLEDVDKIIFFSYPTQSFGAYEHGYLVQSGPTNMGRKKDPTPTGLFFSNWKAVETTSTFNDEWNLRWNFNVINDEGVGWHQYALPGYPASHSCMRLQENDAKQLYDWADQWKLEGANKILANGTPTIIFGAYDFDGKKPWLQLPNDPHALDIKEGDIDALVKPNLQRILDEQKKTEQLRG